MKSLLLACFSRVPRYGPKFYIGDVVGAAGGAAGGEGPAGAGTGAGAGSVPYTPDLKDLKGSTTQSWSSGGTAGELVAERAKASFEVCGLPCFQCCV